MSEMAYSVFEKIKGPLEFIKENNIFFSEEQAMHIKKILPEYDRKYISGEVGK